MNTHGAPNDMCKHEITRQDYKATPNSDLDTVGGFSPVCIILFVPLV